MGGCGCYHQPPLHGRAPKFNMLDLQRLMLHDARRNMWFCCESPQRCIWAHHVLTEKAVVGTVRVQRGPSTRVCQNSARRFDVNCGSFATLLIRCSTSPLPSSGSRAADGFLAYLPRKEVGGRISFNLEYPIVEKTKGGTTYMEDGNQIMKQFLVHLLNYINSEAAHNISDV
ncbi:uncharacterized protein LOC119267338 isoform X1 [Triticum dicoccoides]|uniref:uncharacterized protein LOC119267338 isoform X1 n=1 Tax=Triticum dicoccoides TaxID=85692 RepID=UPI00188E56F7|nr:uncharacterized protein LOC119267338 isoform X1 [Triticum dicoccoides]XP_037404616.1 uncharacterized protein LOC119267338 isoform X1 [Triticum dicoccoides]XP_044322328.1 uncharacterized protein LOC123043801 isoform X2 [Triticum aestivum]